MTPKATIRILRHPKTIVLYCFLNVVKFRIKNFVQIFHDFNFDINLGLSA